MEYQEKCRECGSSQCDPNGGGKGVPECCIDSPAYYDQEQYNEPYFDDFDIPLREV